MITKEKIKNGFKNHIISIESEFGGCISLCCRIGEYAFYFLGFDDEGLTCDTYWKTYTLENTVEMIYKILKDIHHQWMSFARNAERFFCAEHKAKGLLQNHGFATVPFLELLGFDPVKTPEKYCGGLQHEKMETMDLRSIADRFESSACRVCFRSGERSNRA